MSVIAIERFVQFIKDDKTTSAQAAEYLEAMTRQINKNTVQSGTGSPEGVLTAEPKALYMDDAGSAGNILYVKKSGAGDTGWVLV